MVGDVFYKDGGDCWQVFSIYDGSSQGTRPKSPPHVQGVKIQKNPDPSDLSSFYRLQIQGKEVYFPKSCNVLDIEVFKREMGLAFTFNELVAEVICERISLGEGLTRICKDPGMPTYALVSRWRRDVPEFRQMLTRAYEDRAETLRDKILEMEEKIGTVSWSKDDAVALAALRQRFELLKWGASVDGPQKYSDKLKISGDKDSPISFVIETGIRRKDDEGFRRDDPQYMKALSEGKKDE